MTPAILRLVHLRRQVLGASITPATLLNARPPHCWGDFAGQPLRPSVPSTAWYSNCGLLRLLRKSRCVCSRSHQRLQFWLTEAVCHIHPPPAQSPPSLSGTVGRPQYQCPLPRRNRGRAALPLAWRSVPTASCASVACIPVAGCSTPVRLLVPLGSPDATVLYWSRCLNCFSALVG